MRPDFKTHTHPCNLIFFVSPRSVNIAIGPKGACISQTESDTGTSISFDKADVMVCGVESRICRIGGPESLNVVTALKTIWAADENFQEARIAVNDALVAVVIGKSGTMIKELQEQGGAALSFCKPHEMCQLEGQLRALFIQGPDVAICNTIGLVLDLIKDKDDFTHMGMPMTAMPMAAMPMATPMAAMRESAMQRGRPNFMPVKPAFEQRMVPRFDYQDHSSCVEVCEQFFVLPVLVSLAIGKNGSTINRMQQDTQSRISFAKEDEDVGGVNYRRMTISGGVGSVAAAATFVGKLNVNEEMDSSILLIIPDSCVSFIIGSQGMAIKNITQITRAFLSFAKPEEMGQLQGQERILSVRGAPDQIAHALEMVISMKQNCLHRGEKRVDSGQTAPTPKKVKPDASGDDDIVISVPKNMLTDLDWSSIQSTYCVTFNVYEDKNHMVFSISGENAINAQSELQLMLHARSNGVRFRVQAM